MSRYFFDVMLVDRTIKDEIGLDLQKVDQVWPEIAHLLHDHLLAASPCGSRLFEVTVRDEVGDLVARTTSTPPATR